MKNPFKFLEPYNKENFEEFLRPDKLDDKLYKLVKKSRFIVLFGPSGSGKTSLVKCGLGNKINDSDGKLIEIRRYENINESFIKTLKDNFPKVNINEDEKNPLIAINKIYYSILKPLFLFFDQFEELFIAGNDDEISKFLETLKAIREKNIPCTFILVLRKEYFSDLMKFKETAPFVFEHSLEVENMTVEDATKVVKNILEKTVIEGNKINYDDEFIKTLIERVANGHNFVQPPYLQAFLYKVFDIADNDKKSDTINFNKELLEDKRLHSIENIISNLLEDVIKKSCSIFPDSVKYKERKVLEFLKIFVTDVRTKKTLSFEQIINNANNLDIEEQTALKLLNIFVNGLFIKMLPENQYELTHDTIADDISRLRLEKREEPAVEGNPFQGLNAFDEPKSLLFFGRKSATEALLEKFKETKITIVSGASGTGKSSLIRAGLYPKLKENGYQPDSFEDFRPGEKPIKELKKTLERINSKKNIKKL